MESLPESRKKEVNFDCSSYPAAAFVLSAEHLKVPVNKNQLLETTDTRMADFKAVR